MAMNGTGMGDEIEAAVEAVYGTSIPADQKAKMKAIWEAVATAIVAHIKANMVVQSNVSVASVSGVTPGSGASGSGTGTSTSSTIS